MKASKVLFLLSLLISPRFSIASDSACISSAIPSLLNRSLSEDVLTIEFKKGFLGRTLSLTSSNRGVFVSVFQPKLGKPRYDFKLKRLEHEDPRRNPSVTLEQVKEAVSWVSAQPNLLREFEEPVSGFANHDMDFFVVGMGKHDPNPRSKQSYNAFLAVERDPAGNFHVAKSYRIKVSPEVDQDSQFGIFNMIQDYINVDLHLNPPK